MLEEAESALTGNISIEDVTMQNDDEGDTVLRRMVFTSNRNLVQSEAILCPASTGNGDNASKSDGHQADAAPSSTVGNKGKKKAKVAKQKASAARDRQSASNQEQQPLVIDHSQLACDYHKGIIAGLSLIQPHLSTFSQSCSPQAFTRRPSHTQTGAQTRPQQTSQQQAQQQQQQSQPAEQDQQAEAMPEVQTGKGSDRTQALVVGLGGGGLPVFLNRHCDMDVLTIELDPVVVDLARRHFGFADSASLQVIAFAYCQVILARHQLFAAAVPCGFILVAKNRTKYALKMSVSISKVLCLHKDKALLPLSTHQGSIWSSDSCMTVCCCSLCLFKLIKLLVKPDGTCSEGTGMQYSHTQLSSARHIRQLCTEVVLAQKRSDKYLDRCTDAFSSSP